MPKQSKPFDFMFELRVYKGAQRDPSKAIAIIPFIHHARWLPAKARALNMARRLWTLLEYPTPENAEKAGAFFEAETIKLTMGLAEEIEEHPKTYGVLVAITLPAAALPQKQLYEFVRYRPGEKLPSSGNWRQFEAATTLKPPMALK